MPYGLEFDEVRFETDYEGKRLRATIPYPMYSALVEFWIAARRAQTAKLEANGRPGQIKGSMQSTFIPPEAAHSTGETITGSSTVSPHFPNDPQWQNLVSRMPDAVVTVATAAPAPDVAFERGKVNAETTSASSERMSSPAPGTKGGVFFREFMAKPPAEVLKRINEGVYFLRAWREYRELTLDDAAELFGRTAATIYTHEQGRWPPSQATLEKFAQAYDVPLLQLVPLPGSNTAPFPGQATRGSRGRPGDGSVSADSASKLEPQRKPRGTTASKFWKEPVSPADTAYPDAVLAHLKTGKSPLLAWRLYRGMSLAALAEQYGGQAGNVKAMETANFLRAPTIAKLCPILHCKPAQLLRPAGLLDDTSVSKIVEQPAPGAIPVTRATDQNSSIPLSPMKAAFMRAELTDMQPGEASRVASTGHPANRQREISRL